jgi:hypothetical protein
MKNNKDALLYITHMTIQIYCTRYKGMQKLGDFEWMVKRPEFNDVLFIFNDDLFSHDRDHCGAGNAVMRPYNRYGRYKKHPRSAGISTGAHRGWKVTKMESNWGKAKANIDSEVNEIIDLLKTGKYGRVIYSCGKKDHKIGAEIYKPSQDIINYITEKIHSLGEFGGLLE